MSTPVRVFDALLKVAPPMDPYWQEVADFIQLHGLDAVRLVAPVEFSELIDITAGYNNASAADMDVVDSLVLHKGLYRDLEPAFLSKAVDQLHPSFANPVFILLTRTGPELAPDNPHLGDLSVIKEWAKKTTAAPDALQRARMAATYLGQAKVLVETAFGHLMVVPGTDRSISPHLIRDGYFDRVLTDFISKAVKPASTFIDIGANIGTYSLVAADRMGVKGKLIAVEANPRMAQMLRDNLEMNGFAGRSEVFEIAAANSNGDLTLFEFSRHEGSHTMVQDVADKAVDQFAEVVTRTTTPARKLDDLFSETGLHEADLVKIDVEGFELDVLLGFRSFLRIAAPDLIIEWHPSFMSRETASKIYTLLTEDLSYSVARIGSVDMRHFGFDELMSIDHSDIYATRRGALYVP